MRILFWTCITALTFAPLNVTCDPAMAQDVHIVQPKGPMDSLAEAVLAAHPGDKIVVRPGYYEESGVRIDKALSVVGEGRPVIASNDGGQILTIAADGVTVEGLTFRGVSTSFVDDRSAVRIERASDCRLSDNHFDDTFFGVYLARASRCTIENNTFEAAKAGETQSGNGIHLWYSRDVTIFGNHVRGHRDGIYLEFSSRVTVRSNTSVDNQRYGLHFMFSDSCDYAANTFERNDAGVAVMYSKAVTMVENRFSESWGSAAFGLLLKDITDSHIADNTFERNTVGLYAEGSNRIEVLRNIFSANGHAVKIMANSINSAFRHNSFLANTFDVTTNSRQSYSTFEENFWDAYRGYDLDRDGTGDVPFYPVRLFAMIVERHPPTAILMRSLFVDVLDAAERVLPAITPKAIVDSAPLMQPVAKRPHTHVTI